jgi:transposase InsO family protein
MPWQETDAMLQRSVFIAEVASGEFSFSESCRRFGVSRKTGYKWWSRYQLYGVEGLSERSRAPGHCPQTMPDHQAARILALKTKQHPRWGARKLLARLKRLYPQEPWPSETAVGELLAREGLTRSRRRRCRTPPYDQPLAHCRAANEVWSIDFKGQFRLGNGQWCYALTVSDNHCRFLLSCDALRGTAGAPVTACCERIFQEYGLPSAIRSDNGIPFATRGLAGLSPLSVWWIRLGIVPERIEPGRPQQNGRHERMHKTLKAETARPPARDRRSQQRRFDRFRQEYNEIRPHEALGDDPPADHYQPSHRPYPKTLPPVEYDVSMHVRRVRRSGEIKWRGGLVFLSSALIGEPVGLWPISNERWEIFFGTVKLAVLDDRLGKVIRPA